MSHDDFHTDTKRFPDAVANRLISKSGESNSTEIMIVLIYVFEKKNGAMVLFAFDLVLRIFLFGKILMQKFK